MKDSRLQLVVSDFHMGAGPTLPDGTRNFLEDFFFDHKFAEFLDYYCEGDYAKSEIELVIAGDFFNHLQVYPEEVTPHRITERVALARTGAIMNGHQVVFDALKRFASHPRRSIVFLIGNHDIGLFWPAVQRLLAERLGQNVRVHARPEYYKGGVWIEHGNSHSVENRTDFENPFVGRSDDPMLNLTWGNMFVIKFLNRFKMERPYIDKLHPFKNYLQWALFHDTLFALKSMAYIVVYFFQLLMGFGDYRQFRFGNTIKILRQLVIRAPLHNSARRVMRKNPECKIVVFSHSHIPVSRRFMDGREYYNTGMWNELVGTDLINMGRRLRLTYVEVESFDGRPRGSLKEWHGHHQAVEEVGTI